MSNPVNLSPEQMDALLRSLAQQLHTDPATLRQQLQSGNIASLARSMGGDASR